MKTIRFFAISLMLALSSGTFAQSVGINSTGAAPSANAMLEVLQTNTSVTAYGIYGSTSGAATTNYGGYFSATGATNNYGLVVPNGNVGIGTTGPLHKLDIRGPAGLYNAGGDGTLEDILYIGHATAVTSQKHRVRASTSASNTGNILSFETSNGTVGEWNTYQFVLRGTGNVGIGTNDPLHPLHMASGAHVTPAGVWTNASDARLKTNVVNTNYGLQTVMQLRPVNYTMVKGGEAQVGFLAQEVQKIVPEVVSGTEGDIEKGETLGLSYGNLVPVLTKAIQEQQTEIETLKQQVETLQSQNAVLTQKTETIDQLKAEVENMKKAMGLPLQLTENK